MRTNTAKSYAVQTHEGGSAFPHLTAEQRLRRSVMSCLLWEAEFYEDGQTIADRIAEAASAVSPQVLAKVAVEARAEHNLRHVPLLLCVELAKRGGSVVSDTIAKVLQRADEPAEFLSLYWRNGKCPLSKQVKLGLAAALRKFDPYQLAKYNRDSAIKLRDVLFMVHAKPKDEAQAATWKALAEGTLAAPDTWEVALSGGSDKRATFERLIRENNLGYLALLRNLRGMTEAGVDEQLITGGILARKGAHRVLPFRYVAAARACPRFEPALDQALSEAVSEMPALPGKTVVLVDVSGSMGDKLSARSDLTRMDAAAALASIIHGDIRMFSFSEQLVEVPPRRGMAGVDAIIRSQQHRGTHLFDAVGAINAKVPYDRLIVITDEQATGGWRQGYLQGNAKSLPDPKGTGYMINVASAQNGVGYGKWTHLDGFSEGVLRWIAAVEHESR
jgi:hypothetical protein